MGEGEPERSPLYKLRLGEYRIIYQIEDQPLLVTLIKIAHLKDY
ncbi:type II toxin-antitoxin system RelE family toxin [Nostoc commune]